MSDATSGAGADADSAPSFEQLIGELESLVERLEGGELPLEQSIALFERGMKLSSRGAHLLESAEKRVEVLLRGRDGEFEAAPFGDGGGDGL